MFASPCKAGFTTVAALIGVGAALPVSADLVQVQVPWAVPNDFWADSSNGAPSEWIVFDPISNVIGFDRIDQGLVEFVEFSWALYLRLDGDWTPIHTSSSEGLFSDILPSISFAASTLDGIGFGASSDPIDWVEIAALDDKPLLFTFVREVDAVAVPTPGSLPLVVAGLGAVGLSARLRRARQPQFPSQGIA